VAPLVENDEPVPQKPSSAAPAISSGEFQKWDSQGGAWPVSLENRQRQREEGLLLPLSATLKIVAKVCKQITYREFSQNDYPQNTIAHGQCATFGKRIPGSSAAVLFIRREKRIGPDPQRDERTFERGHARRNAAHPHERIL
jgi:hypothetical protein